MKKFFVTSLIWLLIVPAVLTVASGTGEVEEDQGVTTVAVVMPSPMGDRSFVDSAAKGVREANEQLPVHADIVETEGVHEHETAMRGAVNKGYDLILGVGLDTQMMIDLAVEYPDQMFGSPSELFADELPDNLASILINVHKSSFLAGIVAGMLTETNKVGAVCGGDAPGINQFYYGYKQGVLEVNPDAEVFVNYLGFDFSNPTLGKESALALYDEGCDILYQVAGLSGEGVLAAAAERDLYAIGVDLIQDDLYPGHVVTSVVKRVDTSAYMLIEEFVNGNYEGGFRMLGLEDGATELSWALGASTFESEGPSNMVSKLPDVASTVDDYREQILSGDFEVYNALTDELPDYLVK